jgi:hypothetical protein
MIVTSFFNSQAHNNLVFSVFFLITLLSNKTCLSIFLIHLSASLEISEILIILYSVLNIALEKPFNLGILLNKGV